MSGSYLQLKNASLGNTSIDATYAAYTYQAACGIPGSFLAAAMVELPMGGRKWAMAFFTVAAGVFLFGLTAARNEATVNVLTSMASFFENAFCESLPYLHFQVPFCVPLGLFFSRLLLILSYRDNADPRWCPLRLRSRSLCHQFPRYRRRPCFRCFPSLRSLRTYHRRLFASSQDSRWTSIRLCCHLCPVSHAYSPHHRLSLVLPLSNRKATARCWTCEGISERVLMSEPV
jgi:hypothetical protein